MYTSGPRVAFSGGAGLLSTATDYARFMQMMLNGGVLDGVRLLSPTTVALMTSNHVGTLYLNGTLGWGLGFEVVEQTGRAPRYGAAGEFSWSGAYHTTYWADPVEKLVVVFMTQLLPAGPVDSDETRAHAGQSGDRGPGAAADGPGDGVGTGARRRPVSAAPRTRDRLAGRRSRRRPVRRGDPAGLRRHGVATTVGPAGQPSARPRRREATARRDHHRLGRRLR